MSPGMAVLGHANPPSALAPVPAVLASMSLEPPPPPLLSASVLEVPAFDVPAPEFAVAFDVPPEPQPMTASVSAHELPIEIKLRIFIWGQGNASHVPSVVASTVVQYRLDWADYEDESFANQLRTSPAAQAHAGRAAEMVACGSLPRPGCAALPAPFRTRNALQSWHAACSVRRVHFSANPLRPSLPPAGPKFQLGAFQLLADCRFAGGRVGGDFYAFEQRDAKRLVLVVGDACGRDSEAAKLLPSVFSRLEDLWHATNRPARLLEELNRRIVAEMPSDRFVTGAVYEFDAVAGTLRIANAGHVPAILRSARGGVSVIGEASGPPLGVFGDCVYQDKRYRIRKDDVVVFMTDGVLESVETDLAKMPTLLALVAEAPAGSPGIHRFLLENVEDQARYRQPDDRTLLSLQVLASGAATPSIDLERVI